MQYVAASTSLMVVTTSTSRCCGRTDGVYESEKGKMPFNDSRRDADREIGVSYSLSLMRCVQWLTRGDPHSYFQLFKLLREAATTLVFPSLH